MYLVHIVPAKDFPSVMKTGLKPQVPKLDHHRKAMKEFKFPKKVLYCWNGSKPHIIRKRVIDSVYCHVWLWRGNAILDSFELKGKKHLKRVRGSVNTFHCANPPVEDQTFIVLRFRLSATFYYQRYFNHTQTPEAMEYRCWRSLDPRYQHKHHPIIFVPVTLPPGMLKPYAMAWTRSGRH